ncbi:unnamed protein product [Caenorhabditis auriculariae]|uniref:Uncharacterized protein n=1 Tax=Caenorhabditis auriculariae TaxID=2777116 RepID=A0A8S1GUN8_9PELO|nr:unnamed protein product [Caenorhabditis auriculariae]
MKSAQLLQLSSLLLFTSVRASIDVDQLLTVEGSGQKVQEGIVHVTVVTSRVYDPSKNASNLKTLKDTLNPFSSQPFHVVTVLSPENSSFQIDSYSKEEGIKYPSDQIEQYVKNHAGKFAVLYIVYDAECEKVQRFIRGAKNHSKEVSYAILACPDAKTQIL